MSKKAAMGWGKNVKKAGGGAAPEPEMDTGGFAMRKFTARTKGGCFSVRYSHDGSRLAAGYNDGNCFMFDAATGKSKAFGGAYERGRTPVTALRFRPNNFTLGSEESNRILRETFDSIDLDGGGTLDKEEIMEAAWVLKGDIGADDMTEEQFAVIISQLDEDGDGEVDFDEFAHWWRRAVQTTEPADPASKAVMAANIKIRDAAAAMSAADKAHKDALREKLPDRENLKATVMKERRRLEMVVNEAEAAIAAAQGEAEGVYANWPGMLTVGSCHGVIQHWDVATGKLLHAMQETSGAVDEDAGDTGGGATGVNQIYALEFSHDGSIFATGGQDTKVRLYDEETKRLYQVFECGLQNDGRPGHSNRVYAVRFHPEEKNNLISGGWSDTIQLWDLRRKTTIRKVGGPHLSGDALDICGNFIVGGAAKTEDQLQLYDLRTFQPMKTVDWFGGVASPDEPCMIYSAQFNHKSRGRLVAAGGSVVDKAGGKPSPTVKIFDTDTGEVKFSQCCGAVSSVNCSPDGTRLAVGAGDGGVYQYDISSLL